MGGFLVLQTNTAAGHGGFQCAWSRLAQERLTDCVVAWLPSMMKTAGERITNNN